MELSKLKHFKRYMTTFEIEYRKFELIPQRHQLSTILNSTIEELFETLETEDVDISTSHYMIEPIVNWNIGNKFHHHNVTNKHQHIYKNTSQHYKPISYQIPRTS